MITQPQSPPPRLFTDFDGPIMDVSERYYQVYLLCVAQVRQPEQPVQILSKSAFWDLKRAKTKEQDIAIITGLNEGNQPQRFWELRRNTVHTEPYFQHDRLIPTAISALEKMQAAGWELAVMTMRRTRELIPVLEKYDLARFFAPENRFHLADDFIKTDDVTDKTNLMHQAQKLLPPTEIQWMIGDTEADLIAAQTHGVQSIGVLSGIRDQQQLAQLKPKHIAKDLISAIELILNS
jgi:phosphoglycolate phosphatase-like HAD superfamily hydrolase